MCTVTEVANYHSSQPAVLDSYTDNVQIYLPSVQFPDFADLPKNCCRLLWGQKKRWTAEMMRNRLKVDWEERKRDFWSPSVSQCCRHVGRV